MILRLRPADLQRSPYKELIESLVGQWLQAKLPAQGLSYEDYQTTIRTLLLTTQNSDQTTTVVGAVLSQAIALRKTSAWVEQELKFEGMVSGVDRADFLRFELAQASILSDALLDQYNERINRFQPSNE